MSNLSAKLVLITGATGLVGFAVLVSALKTGYAVRAVVRRSAQLDELKSHAGIKPYASHFEAVLIPDMAAEGAFDSALKGVTHILHVGSPTPNPSDDLARDLIEPAVKGTLNLLASAAQTPTVKRVVITSSIVAIVPAELLMNGDSNTVYDNNSRVRPLPSGPWDSNNPMAAYFASKVLALDATERFIAEKKPGFSVVNIMPGVIVGPNYFIINAEQLSSGFGSAASILRVALGVMSPMGLPMNVVGLSDVVRIHVASLDETNVKGSQCFVLDCHRPSFDEVNGIVGAAFPEAVRAGILPLGGSLPGNVVRIDTKATTAKFGPLASYEKDVKDLFAQYLELKKPEESSATSQLEL